MAQSPRSISIVIGEGPPLRGLGRGFDAIRIVAADGIPTVAQLVLSARDIDPGALRAGVPVRVMDDGTGRTRFAGSLGSAGVERRPGSPLRVRVLARDDLALLEGGPRVATWDNATPGTIATQVAQRAGLVARADEPGGAPIVLPHVLQNTTDLAFLQQLARSFGLRLGAEPGLLVLEARPTDPQPLARWDATRDVLRLSVREGSSNMRSLCQVRGRDPGRAIGLLGRASPHEVLPQGGRGAVRPAMGRTILDAAADAFAQTEEAARAIARARMREAAWSAMRATVEHRGPPPADVGQAIALSGLFPGAGDRCLEVASCRWSLDMAGERTVMGLRGWQSMFSSEASK